MITSSRITELLHRKPFRPIRLFLSDGSRHDIPHPEFAWVFGGRVFIGVLTKGDAGGAVKELAILHVTRVEELTPQRSKK